MELEPSKIRYGDMMDKGVWLDALTIESSRVDALRDTYETVKESVYLRLDFYPLCT
jgi:hypothetical protein